MSDNIENNLGEQPIGRIMADHNVRAHDLVAISDVQLTFKMISKARKGRRLTANVKSKVRNALNKCTSQEYALADLFNY